ncbi:hypothetical protein ES705_31491 [subsurface metagenome]
MAPHSQKSLPSRSATGGRLPPNSGDTRLRSQLYCGHGSVVGSAPDKSHVIIIPMTCKSWDCPKCGPLKRAKIVARLLAGQPQRDITLTMPAGRPGSARFHARVMKKAFSKLAARARRAFGIFEYAAVLEFTKQGTPHLHVLQRGTYIPVAWLKRAWVKLGMGYIVHIQRIKSRTHAALHAAKYLGKQFGQTSRMIAPMHCVMFSKNYELEISGAPVADRYPDYLWIRDRRNAPEIAEGFANSDRCIDAGAFDDGHFEFNMTPIILPEFADVDDPYYILSPSDRGPPSLELPCPTSRHPTA